MTRWYIIFIFPYFFSMFHKPSFIYSPVIYVYIYMQNILYKTTLKISIYEQQATKKESAIKQNNFLSFMSHHVNKIDEQVSRQLNG